MSVEEDVRELRKEYREDLRKLDTEFREDLRKMDTELGENTFITTNLSESKVRLEERVTVLESLVSPSEFPVLMTNIARDIAANKDRISATEKEDVDNNKITKDYELRIKGLETESLRAAKIRKWALGVLTALLIEAIPGIVTHLDQVVKFIFGGH